MPHDPWPRGRSRDGGVDRIPLPPDVPGSLWLCGKHAIGPDPDGLLRRVGASSVVCLTERHELADRYPSYVDWLETRVASSTAVWHPIPDLSVPSLERFAALVDGIHVRLRAGEHVVVHCAAGVGRAGTLAVGLMIRLGLPLPDACAHVAAHRPMAGPEVGAQRTLIEVYAEQLR